LKEKKKNIKMILITVLALVVLIPAIVLLIFRLEGKAPEVEVILPSAAVGVSQEFSVAVGDPGSGIRRVKVSVIQDGEEHLLAQEDFPSAGPVGGGRIRQERMVVLLETEALGLDDGEAIIRVAADDYSWRRWWNGNRRVLETPVRIDTRAPSIEVLTRVHNLSPGGSGVVAYRINEDCQQHGVRAGERFFPGHPAPFEKGDFYLAFFALAEDQGPDTPLAVEARDVAGNIGRNGFAHHIRQKRFRSDKIRISDRFLANILPKFDTTMPARVQEPPVDRFLRINREMREENYRQLTQIGDHTEPRILWEGAFGRLPGSARQSSFADRRQYLYHGRIIDRQVHLGVDLASVSHSPVPAANSGRVAFTGEIGIYGKTVAIDHGFGLFSLYSHLSRIDVKPEDVVSKGDILGRTGTTGLAGGDHLHFSMMVARTFVDPVEWWDAAWIRNNVTAKLDALAEEYGSRTQ
jgi:murein DD-endopeptidase MepM/ murein hydrolase activator NlpD